MLQSAACWQHHCCGVQICAVAPSGTFLGERNVGGLTVVCCGLHRGIQQHLEGNLGTPIVPCHVAKSSCQAPSGAVSPNCNVRGIPSKSGCIVACPVCSGKHIAVAQWKLVLRSQPAGQLAYTRYKSTRRLLELAEIRKQNSGHDLGHAGAKTAAQQSRTSCEVWNWQAGSSMLRPSQR